MNNTPPVIDLYKEEWNWVYVSKNPNITWDIIQSCSATSSSNPDKPWDWYSLSLHPNITLSIIQNNPDRPWDWCSLSMNPNIPLSFVSENSEMLTQEDIKVIKLLSEYALIHSPIKHPKLL